MRAVAAPTPACAANDGSRTHSSWTSPALRPFILSDAVLNIAPNLAQARDRAAHRLAHALGIANPQVAVLAAVEGVTAALPAMATPRRWRRCRRKA
jgi:phosphotransacetylase